jgi:hypothetical protein
LELAPDEAMPALHILRELTLDYRYDEVELTSEIIENLKHHVLNSIGGLIS